MRWAWILPMVLLLAVYGYAAVSELVMGRFPETLLKDAVELTAPPDWKQTKRWQYLVQNPLGRELGTATCTRTAGNGRFGLSCQADYDGFDLADEIPGLGQGLESLENLPYDLPTGSTALLSTDLVPGGRLA